MTSARGIRAGRAFVELFADDKRLVRGLRAAERKLKAFGANIRNLGLKMAGLGTAVLAPMLGAAKAFSSMGDQVAKPNGPLRGWPSGPACRSRRSASFASSPARPARSSSRWRWASAGCSGRSTMPGAAWACIAARLRRAEGSSAKAIEPNKIGG